LCPRVGLAVSSLLTKGSTVRPGGARTAHSMLPPATRLVRERPATFAASNQGPERRTRPSCAARGAHGEKGDEADWEDTPLIEHVRAGPASGPAEQQDRPLVASAKLRLTTPWGPAGQFSQGPKPGQAGVPGPSGSAS